MFERFPQPRSALLFRAAVFAASILLSAGSALAFEKWKAYEAPALTCDAGLSVALGPGCLQLSGDVLLETGWDNAAGTLSLGIETGRAAYISDSGLALVIGEKAYNAPELFVLGYGSFDQSTGVYLNEAFVQAGSDSYIRAGLLDPKLDTLAPKVDDFEPLDHFGLILPYPLVDGVRLGGLGVQASADLGAGFRASAGLEDLAGTGGASGWLLNGGPGDGTAIAALSYAGSNLSGKVTATLSGVSDGSPDDWSVNGYIDAVTGDLETLATVSAESVLDNWNAGLTSKLSLRPLYLTATLYQSEGNATEFGGTAELGDRDTEPSAGIGFWRYFAANNSVEDAEVYGSFFPLENLKLSGALGSYLYDDATYAPTEYVTLGATWQPVAGAQLAVVGQAYSDGGAKLVVSPEGRR